MEKSATLLFDGYCYACNWLVNLLLRVDHQKRFKFAALQSEAGRRVINEAGMSSEFNDVETVILVIDGRVYAYSGAVFEVLRILGWPWKVLLMFSVLPRGFTDLLYEAFASVRYRLFGKAESCRLPNANERERFLE